MCVSVCMCVNMAKGHDLVVKMHCSTLELVQHLQHIIKSRILQKRSVQNTCTFKITFIMEWHMEHWCEEQGLLEKSWSEKTLRSTYYCCISEIWDLHVGTTNGSLFEGLSRNYLRLLHSNYSAHTATIVWSTYSERGDIENVPPLKICRSKYSDCVSWVIKRKQP